MDGKRGVSMRVRLQSISCLSDRTYSVTLQSDSNAAVKAFEFEIDEGPITVVVAPDELFAYFGKDGGRSAPLSAAVLAFHKARLLDTDG